MVRYSFKNNLIITLLFSLSALFLNSANSSLAASLKNQNYIKNPIALRINNKFFTEQEIDSRYRYSIKLANLKIIQREEGEVLRSAIIQKIIEEELIRQQGKKLKIEIEDSKIEQSINFFAKRQGKTAKKLKEFFRKNRIDFEAFKSQLEAELIWSQIIEELIRPRIRVSEIEISELMEQRKISDKITRFNLAEIVFEDSPNGLEFSKKMLRELENGADFENMVNQFSMATSSKNGGKIGWFSKEDLNPKIFSAISELKNNQYCEPVMLSDGYHIFKLLGTKSESYLSDEELMIAQNLVANQKLESLSKSYLLDLKKKALIEISPKKI